MSKTEYTYLDYAASAPLRQEALIAMQDYQSKPYSHANPNSLHSQGRAAATTLRSARADIARCLGKGIRPQEVIFTGGGTESNNLAVLGIAEGVRDKDRHKTKVILSAIEHDSVLDLVGTLRDRGFEVVVIRPNKHGLVEPSRLEELLDDTVALVSIMYANNETGVIQPISQLAKLTKKYNAYFHTDAVQAFGRIRLDISDVDALSIAAHKIGGPVGTGALMIRRLVPYRPIVFGGGQELGRRPGTQDVVGCVGFAAAAKKVLSEIDTVRPQVEAMATHTYKRLCANSNIVAVSDDSAEGDLPGMVSIMVKGIDSEILLLKLDEAGYEVSSGSACASDSLDPSHVLSAMNIPSDLAFGQLRISFDERVTLDELDGFCDCLLDIVK